MELKYILTLTLTITKSFLAKAYPYNDFPGFDDAIGIVPRYPDTCCQLEWINIGQHDALPDDYLVAGIYNNR